jgi:hypothetical protein
MTEDPRSVVEGDSAPPSALFAELTLLFLGEPAAVEQMLAQHVDDGTGHCRVCTAGGQTGHYRHPSLIHLAAVEARASGRSGRRV